MPAEPTAPARTHAPGVTLLKIGQIRVVAHGSWLISVALLAWVAHQVMVPDITMTPTLIQDWSMATGFALAIVGCIIVHELAHCWVAMAFGLPVRRITLFLFGGVSHIERESPTPRIEYQVAFAGPLASVILGAVLGYVGRSVNPSISGIPGVWGDFAMINMALAIFNLVPAFPMDGGRLFRSFLWSVRKDRARATRWAAAGGRAFAAFLMIAGAALAVPQLVLNLDSGDARGGVWFFFIGMFLYNAAGSAGRAEGGGRPNDEPLIRDGKIHSPK